MIYICSPLSAPTRAEMLTNAGLAIMYCAAAEQEFHEKAVAPQGYLPYLLDDRVPEERTLALEFDLRLLQMCDCLAVYGTRISPGMTGEILEAKRLGIPIVDRTDGRLLNGKGGSKHALPV